MINNAILGVIAGQRIAPAGPTDPYFAYVVALLHFNDTAGSSSFYDEITASDVWIGAAGAVTSATQSKFGGLSLSVLDTDSRVAVATRPGFNYGSNDFTIEMWIRPVVLGGVKVVFDHRDSTGPVAPRPAIYLFDTQLRYYVNGADRISGGTVAINTWYHIAVSRVSGQTRMYLDGVQVGSTWADATVYTEGRCVLATPGDDTGSFLAFQGYMDDVRLTNGVGRYAGASFTVPSAQFPDA